MENRQTTGVDFDGGPSGNRDKDDLAPMPAADVTQMHPQSGPSHKPDTVHFLGGTSGDDHDYLAPTPDGGVAQPVLRTETFGAVPSTIHMTGGPRNQPGSDANEGSIYSTKTPDFMPTGGGTGSGTDIEDPFA